MAIFTTCWGYGGRILDLKPRCPHGGNFITENFDALKRYKSTEVDRTTWLHVPSGTHWSNSSDTHQVVEI